MEGYIGMTLQDPLYTHFDLAEADTIIRGGLTEAFTSAYRKSQGLITIIESDQRRTLMGKMRTIPVVGQHVDELTRTIKSPVLIASEISEHAARRGDSDSKSFDAKQLDGLSRPNLFSILEVAENAHNRSAKVAILKRLYPDGESDIARFKEATANGFYPRDKDGNELVPSAFRVDVDDWGDSHITLSKDAVSAVTNGMALMRLPTNPALNDGQRDEERQLKKVLAKGQTEDHGSVSLEIPESELGQVLFWLSASGKAARDQYISQHDLAPPPNLDSKTRTALQIRSEQALGGTILVAATELWHLANPMSHPDANSGKVLTRHENGTIELIDREEASATTDPNPVTNP